MRSHSNLKAVGCRFEARELKPQEKGNRNSTEESFRNGKVVCSVSHPYLVPACYILSLKSENSETASALSKAKEPS